eukprot:353699-Chlamydomonas_euryale.AAC.2
MLARLPLPAADAQASAEAPRHCPPSGWAPPTASPTDAAAVAEAPRHYPPSGWAPPTASPTDAAAVAEAPPRAARQPGCRAGQRCALAGQAPGACPRRGRRAPARTPACLAPNAARC